MNPTSWMIAASCLWLASAGCTGEMSAELEASTPSEEGRAPLPGEPMPPGRVPSGELLPEAKPPLEVPAPGACEGVAPSLGVESMRRLSKREYVQTMQDLLGVKDLGAVATELKAAADLYPKDGAGVRFSNMDVQISQHHIDAQFRVASALGDQVADDEELRVRLIGECARGGVDEGCVQQFFKGFATRAMRRAVGAEDRARYEAMMMGETAPAGENWRVLVMGVMMSPEFNYHLEQGLGGGGSPQEEVDAWALANRLAYLFWQTMPDAELFAAAQDGSLLTDQGYATQLERVFDHPKTHQTIAAFFSELYHLDSVPRLNANDPVYKAMTQGGLEGVLREGADFRGAMRREIEQLTTHYTWKTEGTFADLWRSRLSFADTPELAALYGVEPWDGMGEPPLLPQHERAGLLTRAAFLVSGISETSPIHRGIHLYRDTLCGTIPSPDPQALPAGSLTLPPQDGTQSMRQVVEQKTAGAQCVGCHAQFNAYGFALEAYDALGRWRSEETIYSKEGEVLGHATLDLGAAVVHQGKQVSISGPVQMSDFVASDPKAAQCFATHYFRFAHGREPVQADACELQVLSRQLTQHSLRQTFRAVASSKTFRLRHLSP